MSKYNVSEEDANQLFGEIDNQGFDYWLTNYASSSKELQKYPELYKMALEAAEAIDKVEDAFVEEGILE